MKKFRINGFIGIWIILTILVSSCVKTDTTTILKDDEQRILKQYLITHSISTVPQSSGLYFIPFDSTNGIQPDSSDVLLYNYEMRLISDKVISTNLDSVAKMNRIFNQAIFYRPLESRLSWAVSGLQEGFQLMHEGQTARLIIPSQLAFGATGSSSDGIGQYYSLIYDLHLIKVIHDPIIYEKQEIDTFLKSPVFSNLNVVRNDSGVYHIVLQEGTGNVIGDSTTVTMIYSLKLLDGTVVQEVMNTEKPFVYDIATNAVIPGFKQAILEMKNTEEAIIIIPYKQGYGEPSGNLPAFSTLVYFISILSVVDSNGAK